MITKHNTRTFIYRVVALALLASLTACGGGDKKKKDPCDTVNNLSELFACAFKGLTFGSPVSAGFDTGSAKSTQFAEYEPNNSLDNGNIVSIPFRKNDAPAGLEIGGTLNSASDPADFFVFTPSHSGSYNAYLCADTCNEILQDDGIYIMIYDQSQTTVAATPIGATAVQEITADLTAGLAYYVEIRVYGSEGANRDYRLVIADPELLLGDEF